MKSIIISLTVLVSGLFSLASAKDYRFVVMGDNRHNRPVVMPEVYEQIIEEVNLLRPDFVMLCGDLILGYTDSDSLIREEWKEFKRVTSKFEMPYYLVVGNHDVWDELSQSIYQEECGDLYYSFDHKESSFIIIDTDVAGELDFITGDQLEWLEKTLSQKSGSKHIFIFMHKPLWTFEDKPGEAWNEQVHPLLVKYGVDYVFAGHDHSYYIDYLDGIRYIVSGGAGAPIGDYPEVGNFYHYLFCTVRNDTTTIAVIKPGNVSSEKTVLYADVERHRKIRTECLGYPYLDLPLAAEEDLVLIVANPFSTTIEGNAKWQMEDSENWQIQPEEQQFTVSPGCQLGLEFKILPPPGTWYPTPVVRVAYPFDVEKDPISIERDIRLVPEYDCRRAELPVVADGELSDWAGVETIKLNDSVQVASRDTVEWKGVSDKSGQVAFVWDDEYLYFSAHIIDDTVYQRGEGGMLSRGDCVILCFDVGDDPRGVGELDEFLTIYFFARTEEDVKVFRSWPSSDDEVCSVEEIAAVVKKTDDGENYEARIPWKALKAGFLPEKNTVIGLDIVIPDNDGSGREDWLQWTPGIMERGDTSYFGKLCLR